MLRFFMVHCVYIKRGRVSVRTSVTPGVAPMTS